MPRQNILIVAVDGLRASALGSYGNTSYGTPALDGFAAESFVLDSCYAPAITLDEVYRALWQSQHPQRPERPDHARPSLPGLLSSRGYSTMLVTDENEVMANSAARDFDHCVHLATPTERETVARSTDVSQTAIARLFAAACEAIASGRPLSDAKYGAGEFAPRLVWVHSRGMYGPWDAPIDLQRVLLEEGDPPPLESAIPPDIMLSEDADPDTTFRLGCAYAAQIMVFDACWTGLMEVVRAEPDDEPWLTILIGVRGYPLGEHRRIGGVEARLYREQLHVPWLIRFPDGRGRLARSSALVSHVDLWPTLADRTGDLQSRGLESDGDSVSALISNLKLNSRDALLATSRTTGSRAIRTTAWCLLQHTAAADSADESREATCTGDELYVRPDDRWEANDVAKLCRDTVEQLALASDNLALQIGCGQRLSSTNQSEVSPAAQS